VKGSSLLRPDPWPAVLLAIGYTLSSVAIFAVVWSLGAGMLRPWLTGSPVWVAVGCVLVVLILAEIEAFGLSTPMWRRQTPKWFMYRFGNRTTALFWGLDTGLVVTTFRVTSLSWAALSLAFFGVVPWWAGAAYALGFVVPELIADLLIPRRRDPTGRTDPEPTWLLDALRRVKPLLRPMALTMLVAATGWSAVMVAAAG
jgi:hypothetical protein